MKNRHQHEPDYIKRIKPGMLFKFVWADDALNKTFLAVPPTLIYSQQQQSYVPINTMFNLLLCVDRLLLPLGTKITKRQQSLSLVITWLNENGTVCTADTSHFATSRGGYINNKPIRLEAL